MLACCDAGQLAAGAPARRTRRQLLAGGQGVRPQLHLKPHKVSGAPAAALCQRGSARWALTLATRWSRQEVCAALSQALPRHPRTPSPGALDAGAGHCHLRAVFEGADHGGGDGIDAHENRGVRAHAAAAELRVREACSWVDDVSGWSPAGQSLCNANSAQQFNLAHSVRPPPHRLAVGGDRIARVEVGMGEGRGGAAAVAAVGGALVRALLAGGGLAALGTDQVLGGADRLKMGGDGTVRAARHAEPRQRVGGRRRQVVRT